MISAHKTDKIRSYAKATLKQKMAAQSKKRKNSVIGQGGGTCRDMSLFHFINFGEQLARGQVYCTLCAMEPG